MTETSEKTLYRSNNAPIAGVCGGIADYFCIDESVVRILCIVLTILTGGVLALVYLALWVILPVQPIDTAAAPVEVDPAAVQSEVYGATAAPNAHASYAPPTTQPIGGAPYYAASAPTSTAGAAPTQPAPSANSEGTDNGVKAGLVFGLTLVICGTAVLVTRFIPQISITQFWPLIFVVWGAFRMVVPGKPGHRIDVFTWGLILFVFGLFAALCTFDIVRPYYEEFFSQMWPLFVVICGFCILSSACKMPALKFIAVAIFIAGGMCMVMMYSDPGSLNSSLMLPVGHVTPQHLFVGM